MMRVLQVLLLSALLPFTKGVKDTNKYTEGAMILEAAGSSNSLQCNTCNSANYLNNPDCENWDITVDFNDYGVFNFFCGCAARITGLSQCRRFADDSLALVEKFTVDSCGVQTRCQVVDFDDQANAHSCKASCGLLLFLCNAKCDTTCYFGLQCEALTPVDNGGGGGGGGGGKGGKGGKGKE
jgi:hypothetical protein